MNDRINKIKLRTLRIRLPHGCRSFTWKCTAPGNLRHIEIFYRNANGNIKQIYAVNALSMQRSFHAPYAKNKIRFTLTLQPTYPKSWPFVASFSC